MVLNCWSFDYCMQDGSPVCVFNNDLNIVNPELVDNFTGVKCDHYSKPVGTSDSTTVSEMYNALEELIFTNRNLEFKTNDNKKVN